MLSSYALSVMVIHLFNLHRDLRHPLAVLRLFLSYYQRFPWDTHVLTLEGPAPIQVGTISSSSSDNNSANSNRQPPPSPTSSHHLRCSNRFQPVLDKLRATLQDAAPNISKRVFQRSRPSASSSNSNVSSSGQSSYRSISTTSAHRFVLRSCNIQDPVDESNNLGYSVTRNNLGLIDRALHLGSGRLEALLQLSQQNVHPFPTTQIPNSSGGNNNGNIVAGTNVTNNGGNIIGNNNGSKSASGSTMMSTSRISSPSHHMMVGMYSHSYPVSDSSAPTAVTSGGTGAPILYPFPQMPMNNAMGSNMIPNMVVNNGHWIPPPQPPHQPTPQMMMPAYPPAMYPPGYPPNAMMASNYNQSVNHNTNGNHNNGNHTNNNMNSTASSLISHNNSQATVVSSLQSMPMSNNSMPPHPMLNHPNPYQYPSNGSGFFAASLQRYAHTASNPLLTTQYYNQPHHNHSNSSSDQGADKLSKVATCEDPYAEDDDFAYSRDSSTTITSTGTSNATPSSSIETKVDPLRMNCAALLRWLRQAEAVATAALASGSASGSTSTSVSNPVALSATTEASESVARTSGSSEMTQESATVVTATPANRKTTMKPVVTTESIAHVNADTSSGVASGLPPRRRSGSLALSQTPPLVPLSVHQQQQPRLTLPASVSLSSSADSSSFLDGAAKADPGHLQVQMQSSSASVGRRGPHRRNSAGHSAEASNRDHASRQEVGGGVEDEAGDSGDEEEEDEDDLGSVGERSQSSSEESRCSTKTSTSTNSTSTSSSYQVDLLQQQQARVLPLTSSTNYRHGSNHHKSNRLKRYQPQYDAEPQKQQLQQQQQQRASPTSSCSSLSAVTTIETNSSNSSSSSNSHDHSPDLLAAIAAHQLLLQQHVHVPAPPPQTSPCTQSLKEKVHEVEDLMFLEQQLQQRTISSISSTSSSRRSTPEPSPSSTSSSTSSLPLLHSISEVPVSASTTATSSTTSKKLNAAKKKVATSSSQRTVLEADVQTETETGKETLPDKTTNSNRKTVTGSTKQNSNSNNSKVASTTGASISTGPSRDGTCTSTSDDASSSSTSVSQICAQIYTWLCQLPPHLQQSLQFLRQLHPQRLRRRWRGLKVQSVQVLQSMYRSLLAMLFTSGAASARSTHAISVNSSTATATANGAASGTGTNNHRKERRNSGSQQSNHHNINNRQGNLTSNAVSTSKTGGNGAEDKLSVSGGTVGLLRITALLCTMVIGCVYYVHHYQEHYLHQQSSNAHTNEASYQHQLKWLSSLLQQQQASLPHSMISGTTVMKKATSDPEAKSAASTQASTAGRIIRDPSTDIPSSSSSRQMGKEPELPGGGEDDEVEVQVEAQQVVPIATLTSTDTSTTPSTPRVEKVSKEVRRGWKEVSSTTSTSSTALSRNPVATHWVQLGESITFGASSSSMVLSTPSSSTSRGSSRYMWTKNDVAYEETSQPVLTIAAKSLQDSGHYRCYRLPSPSSSPVTSLGSIGSGAWHLHAHAQRDEAEDSYFSSSASSPSSATASARNSNTGPGTSRWGELVAETVISVSSKYMSMLL